ncbi:MAG: LysM domain-containing protein [Chloroflexota bacterium]
MVSRINWLILLLLATLIVAAGCNMAAQSTVAQASAQISTPAPEITCEQLVTLAETTVGLVCESMGRNQACYGNRLVSVDFAPNSGLSFQQSGDTVDLLAVRRLSTSPLNIRTRDWGIAVIKAQANLPDALPGQNVTFLLYGDTTLDNPSPQMNAVTVSTRIGSTSCADAPESGVLIQSPEGSNVVMNVNGADVTLGSTAFVTTNLDTQRMTFAVLEGQGVVSAFGITQVIVPGMKTGIQLGGGADGLQASGPPNAPAPYEANSVAHLPIQLLDRQIVIPPPLDPSLITPVASATNPATTAPLATACAPRPDWQYRYTVQPGDYLSTIALKLNMRTDDLQVGNCIVNPNLLVVGQQLRIPFPAPTNTPPPPTITPTSIAPIGPNFRADSTQITYRSCTIVRWDVDNVDKVYFEGQPVISHDSRQVCPPQTTTYTLLIVLFDGSRQTYPLTITVGPAPTPEPVCGNNICEPGENSNTCSADCLIIY